MVQTARHRRAASLRDEQVGETIPSNASSERKKHFLSKEQTKVFVTSLVSSLFKDTHVLRLHNDDSASSDEESAAAGTSSEAFSAQLRKRIARQQAKDKQKLLLMMRKQLASAPKRKKLLSVEVTK